MSTYHDNVYPFMLDVEDIPQNTNNDDETSRQITDTSSTTTANQKDVSTNENVTTSHNVLHGNDSITSYDFLSSFSIKTKDLCYLIMVCIYKATAFQTNHQ